ncbi:reverse transcriptase domain-containing protein [Mesobacillus stamsii]|uniref:Reverse transcriptase domain-containing protein n=1 Tax=Mesobacillus stamsii TaxID=225347 RepID=A0ABU0FWE7_9BACI|nr:reverse transcriptase domain-containing protein [Mesobacillus stamsii]MDQ0414244.1 hypothetical protein [Mesobacillus stamsii]
MINIKRYCKDVDITNVSFIEDCIFKYLNGKKKSKWGRRDVQKFLSDFSGFDREYIRFKITNNEKYELFPIIRDIAVYMSNSIKNKELKLKPIRYHTIVDGMTHKERVIGVQHPLHQMFDYVVVEGLHSMFDAKIGVFQCASIPKRGQAYGKKYVNKWVNEKDTTYFVKGDIKQCFPSIPHDKLMNFIIRDVKNSLLVWLTSRLLTMFNSGLSIGSYLSQYLCNYYLSYAYHYASEQLFKIRETKKRGDKRIRLISHILFYMDDFLLTGSSKKDLKRAMKMLIKYINDFLGLIVKPNWKINKLSETEPIDMMGFVFRKNRTTIREKIFLKTRRYFLKVKKLLKQNKSIPLHLAYQCISANGWYVNTNSHKIRDKLNMDEIVSKCKKIISYHHKMKRSGIYEDFSKFSTT